MMLSRFSIQDFPAGSIMGIPVRIHFLLVVLLLYQVLRALVTAGDTRWKAMVYAFTTYGPVLCGTVLIHELGHCLAARQVGGQANKIILWPLGGLAVIQHDAGPKRNIWVSAAGPLTHIPLALLFFLLGFFIPTGPDSDLGFRNVYDSDHLLKSIMLTATAVNVTLFIVNLLVPAYPLDAGHILIDCLLLLGVRDRTAAMITVIVSVVIAGIVLVAGVFVRSFRFGFFLCAFILYGTAHLASLVWSGELHKHPQFQNSTEQQQSEGNQELQQAEV